MQAFNLDALLAKVQTHNSRHTGQHTSADELVRRTLAQHGLAIPDNGALFQSPEQQVVTPAGAGFHQDQYTCDAGTRAYRTYVPSTIDTSADASSGKAATGLVVMLHGCTQNPEDFAAGTGMNELAEQHRFIVLYPRQSRGDNAQSCWNWFSRGDQRRERGEPAILAGMTRKVMEEHGVPANRTFVAGLSAGAAMAVILGETHADVFSAVGAHSGLPYGAAKDVASAFAAMAGNVSDVSLKTSAASPVRTIVFHGTADATVHPSNGDRIARNIMDRGASLTLESSEQGSASGRRFSRRILTRPDGTTELEHWSIDGLGHAWCGGKPGGSYTDGKGPDASAEMIRFFFE